MKFLLSFSLFMCLILSACTPAKQATGLDLQVTWKLNENHAEGGHSATWTLKNNSGTTLTPENWAMYWNISPRGIKDESVTAPVTMRWINGDFYEMKPKAGFALNPGESITIAYEGTDFLIKESDSPKGVYSIFTSGDGNQEAIPVTDFTIGTFERPEQINRDGSDQEPIPTPEWLYDQHSAVSEMPASEMELVLPTPQKTTKGGGTVTLSAQTAIHYEEGLETEATLLAEQLSLHLAGSVTATQSNDGGEGIISLGIAEVAMEGAYTLEASGGGVTISGDAAGVFYGTQSLIALLPVEALGKENASMDIPEVKLEDSPAYAYRGMFVDISRNFNSVATLKKLIDIMAFYKLNRFHVHLSEDEGWRIEIEELPELTQMGSLRGHTMDDADHLQPSYGSGPFPDPSKGYGSGFYSREEFKGLLQYAWDRHIQVIPEINVPGHSRAAVKAMEHRYRRLMAEGKEEAASEYRLADPDDASTYKSAQWYTDNVICVCRESAFKFVTTVIDDIIEMYQEAGVPLEIFHTGGDEVPRGVWAGSPICQAYMKDHPEVDNPKNLQKAFFNRVQAYLAGKGLQAGGWEEIVQNFAEDGTWTVNEDFSDAPVVPYVWNSLWGAEDLGNKLINAGYSTVLCNVTNFYFDLAYNKDPREPGLYWAGFVDTKDAFSFVPNDVFKSIHVSSFGKVYTDADFEGLEKMKPEARPNLLGLQGQLWSETVKGQDMLEYDILPKMLGLAERAWVGQTDWGDIDDRASRNAAFAQAWNAFANVLGRKEFARMDHLFGGYQYRLAPPGAKAEGGQVMANVAYPGMVIRYTTDGSEPTASSSLYEGPISASDKTVKLRTFSPTGRSSYSTTLSSN